MVTSAVRKHLPAQARILIDFEHINAGVGNAGVSQHGQRLLPGSNGLAGQAGDQIKIQIVNSRGAQPAERLQGQRRDCAAGR